MATRKDTKEVLGGHDGTARWPLRSAPLSALFPMSEVLLCKTSNHPRSQEIITCRTPENAGFKTDATVRPTGADPIFGETIWGHKFRGQDIRFMKNSQLYALSEQVGYRRR